MKPTGVTFTGLPNTGEGHLNRGDFLSFTHNPTTVTVKVPDIPTDMDSLHLVKKPPPSRITQTSDGTHKLYTSKHATSLFTIN
jgi:hypothetical protein